MPLFKELGGILLYTCLPGIKLVPVITLAFIDLTLGMVVGHDQEKALSDCNKIVQMYITLKIDFPTT